YDLLFCFLFFFFFFQAEDGIRDRNVTGVQTCALPIFFDNSLPSKALLILGSSIDWYSSNSLLILSARFSYSQLLVSAINEMYFRSEERRVGKECRYWWWPYQ